MKLGRQAEQALTATRNILNPLQNVTENLQAVSARVAEFGATTQGQLRQLEHWRKFGDSEQFPRKLLTVPEFPPSA